MIKMFIDNEEVVSDREFTINEEMLSASSTILNNCYPKSWELTKDYISNFYYPKDYSKFLLGKGEFEHGDEEYGVLNVSGDTFMQFTTNVEKEWNSFDVYGNTYQETRSGKNLLKIRNTVDRGLTTTINSDGSISINGTATETLAYLDKGENIPLTAGTYTLSIETATTVNIRVFLYNGGTQVTAMTISSGNKTTTTTINQNITSYSAIIYGLTAENSYNLTLKPMLESGSQATPFEPYGVMPSPDYPSELVSVGYTNLFNKDDYNLLNACYIDGTGKVVYGNNNKLTWLKLQPNTTYTLTQTKVSNVNRRVALFSSQPVANLQGTLLGTFSGTNPINQTFTTNDTNIYLGWVYCNLANLNNTTEQEMLDSIQITQGTQAHSYIPYGKYGIEIKVQGKNLHNGVSTNKYAVSSTGEIRNGNARDLGFENKIIVQPNTTYTVKFYDVLGNYSFFYSTYDNNNNFIRRIQISSTNGTATFTTDSNTHYIFGWLYSTSDTFTTIGTNIQLEEGTQATEYEPYKENTQLYTLDEPLRAIGEYKDRLYIENGILYVERKIGSVILNGSESWSKSSNTSADIFSYNLSNGDKNGTTETISNYFKYVASNIVGSCRKYNSYIYLIPTVYGTLTIKQFKTWLSTHNTEVQYILAEPYKEVIGQVDIPYSYEGINNITFDTGIDTEETIYYYWKNYDVLFAGIVKNSGDISLNPRYPHYCSLQILDYKTFLSESNTLDFVIANKTVKEAINMVVNAVKNYGFVVGDINISGADDIIGAYSTLNKSAYDVLQYLASISGSRWRARYVNSSTMAIDFYDPDTLPQAEDIEYTKEYWENNNIVDMTFNYGTRDYRNKQILLSDEVYANINYDETLISNGYSNTFTVQNNIGLVVSVIVNNEEKTVGTNNDKQMGIDADFYYTPGKNIIESNVIYPASTLIHLTYQPLVKGRQIVYNNSEVDRISRQTDTEGVIARYETRNDILSSDELEKIAQTYIEYKGKAEVILTLKTQNKDLYNIGEVVYFNAPIDELKQNYMVKTKQIEYVVINDIINLFYIYEMTSSFNSEKAINYFDNQRNKASGNIADGESITRNIDIETEVGIIWTEGSVSSASVTVTGDNLLNSALNSPFVE